MRRVRVRSEVLTFSDGEKRRVWRVTGPTGLIVARYQTSHAEAVRLADVESRGRVWRLAADTHGCSTAALLRCRPVGVEGIYCGHGRFLGTGDWFYVDGRSYQLGQPTAEPATPLYTRAW